MLGFSALTTRTQFLKSSFFLRKGLAVIPSFVFVIIDSHISDQSDKVRTTCRDVDVLMLTRAFQSCYLWNVHTSPSDVCSLVTHPIKEDIKLMSINVRVEVGSSPTSDINLLRVMLYNLNPRNLHPLGVH